MTLLVSPELRGSSSEKLAGKKLRLPADEKYCPSTKALERHRKKSEL